MKLSTSTNLFSVNRNKPYTGTIESMMRCKKAGFDNLDMNFCPTMRGQTEFVTDNWKQVAYEVRNTAERLGIAFGQSHLPFHPGHMPVNPIGDPGYMERLQEMTRRAVIVSGMLGVKWAVVHPYASFTGKMYSVEEDIRLNIEQFSPVIEQCLKAGVGVAFENILGMKEPMRRRFSATAEELIALVDSFHDPRVQICWDFGHGNRMYDSQARPLRLVGSRLKATHVDDNRGNYDAHLLPFIGGNTNWEEIMGVLAEIGYEGDFALEIQKFVNDLPTDELKDEAARLSFEIGSYLLSLSVK